MRGRIPSRLCPLLRRDLGHLPHVAVPPDRPRLVVRDAVAEAGEDDVHILHKIPGWHPDIGAGRSQGDIQTSMACMRAYVRVCAL